MPPTGSSAAQGNPRRKAGTGFRIIGDEALIALPGRAEIKVVNPVGATVYKLIDGTHTIGQIVDAVLEEYDTTREVAESDVQRFLQELAEHGMLEDREAGA